MRRALVWLNLYGREVVRCKLKNSLKTKKCTFCLFLSLCGTASQPYRLSHTNALCINQSYQPKDKFIIFLKKNIENWRSLKASFFLVGHFDLFFKKNFLFCFFPMKTNLAFISGIIFLCTMDGFFRILEKTSSELICKQL